MNKSTSNWLAIASKTIIEIPTVQILDCRDSNLAVKGSWKYSPHNSRNSDHAYVKSLELKSMKSNSIKSDGVKMFNNQSAKQELSKTNVNVESVGSFV